MANTDDRIRRRVRISGRVQGVGYRESCRREARVLGITGTVRNLGDGSVEAVFEGAAPAVDRMIAWCHRGPRSADVRHVDVGCEQPTGESGFTISF
jgi:acylphosphatase